MDTTLKDKIIPETLEDMRAEGEYGRELERIVTNAIVRAWQNGFKIGAMEKKYGRL
jgi:hypothetical protein